MTPAQLQEHSTSSAGDMQGKWAGSEPALLPPAQPCALIHSSQAAFAGWELLDSPRAAWASGRLSLRGQGSAVGNVHSLVWARCGAQPPRHSCQAHLPRASLLRRRKQQLHETPSLSQLESRALSVWRLGKHSEVSPAANTACPDRAQPARSRQAAAQPVALGWPAWLRQGLCVLLWHTCYLIVPLGIGWPQFFQVLITFLA